MGLEIERKFLVRGKPWLRCTGVRFSQGYLNRDPVRTVRVRIAGRQGFITIKGSTRGASRAEFEYEIPLAVAEELSTTQRRSADREEPPVVVHEGSTWEIDEFLGDDTGLVIAEIQLASEDQPFSRPWWLGDEAVFKLGFAFFQSSRVVSRCYSVVGGSKKTRSSSGCAFNDHEQRSALL